jgi:hypothetical protein
VKDVVLYCPVCAVCEALCTVALTATTATKSLLLTLWFDVYCVSVREHCEVGSAVHCPVCAMCGAMYCCVHSDNRNRAKRTALFRGTRCLSMTPSRSTRSTASAPASCRSSRQHRLEPESEGEERRGGERGVEEAAQVRARVRRKRGREGERGEGDGRYRLELRGSRVGRK